MEWDTVIVCDECGRENDDEYKFCLGCGAALSDSEDEEEQEEETVQVNCPFCGAEQPAKFKFCGSCGEKIPDSVISQGGGGGGGPEVDDHSTSPGKPGGPGESGGAAVAQESAPSEEAPNQSQPGTGGFSESGGSTAPDGRASAEPAPGGAAKSDAPARLVVIRPDGTEGSTIDVPEAGLTLGRSSDYEALSSDPFLSPEHARVEFDGSEFTIRDQGSLNGIFREVTGRARIRDGSHIRIGQELLRVELFDDDSHAGGDGTLEGGSPDPGYWGRLALVAGPDLFTEAYALGDDEVTVGRESGDIVFRDDGFVSGTHARVAKVDGVPMVEDLDSSNGTFLRIREEYTLDPGERVLMGQQLFRMETT